MISSPRSHYNSNNNNNNYNNNKIINDLTISTSRNKLVNTTTNARNEKSAKKINSNTNIHSNNNIRNIKRPNGVGSDR